MTLPDVDFTYSGFWKLNVSNLLMISVTVGAEGGDSNCFFLRNGCPRCLLLSLAPQQTAGVPCTNVDWVHDSLRELADVINVSSYISLIIVISSSILDILPVHAIEWFLEIDQEQMEQWLKKQKDPKRSPARSVSVQDFLWCIPRWF